MPTLFIKTQIFNKMKYDLKGDVRSHWALLCFKLTFS